MSDGIQVGDRVEWLHTQTEGSRSGAEHTRKGKVVTISGDMAYVRIRRASQPVRVALHELAKIEPVEKDEVRL